MGKDAENFTRTDPGLLSKKLELWQYAHDLQGRYDSPLIAVDLNLSALQIVEKLYEALQLKAPEVPKGREAVDFLIGRLEAMLETGQGSAAATGNPYGGTTPDYIDSSGSGHSRRMRNDSSGADAQRARYAARIEANGGQRGRRASASNLGATGGEGLRTDAMPAGGLQWQTLPNGSRFLDLNQLHPGVQSAGVQRRGAIAPPPATDSVQPAASVQRIEDGSKRKRKKPAGYVPRGVQQ